MLTSVLKFLSQDAGAVTVDWTVLTASVVGLGLGGAAAVRSGTVSLGNGIDSSLSAASVAVVQFTDDPTAGWDFSSDTGYRNMQFYFFTSAGVDNWYRNNVEGLSDADLMAALDTRRAYMESELAMGPDDAPSYGEPWGHTDMYHLTLWEAQHRGLI